MLKLRAGNVRDADMLWCSLMRRPLILVLALNLLGLGPVPLSACAIFSSQQVECATPATQSECDQMNMDDTDTNAAPVMDTSCCRPSSAPVPVSLQGSTELSLTSIPAHFVDSRWQLPQVEVQRPASIAKVFSPPPLHSLLCTFLI